MPQTGSIAILIFLLSLKILDKVHLDSAAGLQTATGLVAWIASGNFLDQTTCCKLL
jgi:hypothetical protein